MNKAVRGVYAAAVSPFRADGSLDLPKLVRYCQYLLRDGGCDGVAPLGTTGEGNSIAMSDRMALPSALAEAEISPDRVILGTGACAVGDAIAMSKNAIKHGYVNQLVLPPFYYKTPSDEGLYQHFARLIDGVSRNELRIYLYHFPQLSMVPFSCELVTRLKRDFGTVIAGLKDSSGDFEQSRAFAKATGGIEADFDIYPSSEAMYFDGTEAGCAGVISGSTNAFAKTLQQAILSGDPKDFETVKQARDLAGKYPMMAAMKQIEAWRSGDETWQRMASPLEPLSSEEQSNLRADLKSLNNMS